MRRPSRGVVVVALALVSTSLLAPGLVVASGDVASAGSRSARGTRSSPRCDWPTWGRDLDRTFAARCPSRISPATVPRLARRWFFNARDVVTASPAVTGDTVYVGDWQGNFYALRRRDGRLRWRYATKPHPNVYSGQIVGSAAVAEVGGVRTVFFPGGKTLFALRASDGKLRWKHTLNPGGDPSDPTEIETSPAIVDGMVVFGYDVHNSSKGAPSGVIALAARTGRTRWDFHSAPAPGGPTTGASATGAGCGDVWSSPAVDRARGAVYVGTANCPTSPEGYGPYAEALISLDLHTGKPRWTYQPHPPNNDDFDFAGAPNLFAADGRALVGLGSKDAVYYAVDRDTGTLVWSTKVAEPGLTRPGSNYSTGGFIGPAAVSDGTIVGGTAVGGAPYLHALDAATGRIVWQQPEASATYAATAITNGVVFSGGTDFTLRALDLHTGAVLWSQEVAGAVSGGAAIVGSDVVAVAGIREPGLDKPSRTSGVYLFSLTGTPVASSTTTTSVPRSSSSTGAGAAQRCVGSPCTIGPLTTPPPGTDPSLTLQVSTAPWRVVAHASGLGPPSGWIRPGSLAARTGARVYGLVASESDDNPVGGILCVLDADLACTSSRIPRAGATYNRITLLALAGPDALPGPAEGIGRLVATVSFSPPLQPQPG